MNKLSRREKILICLLIAVVIVIGGGYYMLLPEYRVHSDKQTQLETLKTEEATVKLSIETKGSLAELLNNLWTTYDNTVSIFSPPMPNEQLDRFITDRLNECNLKIYELTVAETEENEYAAAVRRAIVDVNVEGSLASVAAMLDKVSAIPYITVASVSSINNDVTEENTLLDIFDGNFRFTIAFNVYTQIV